jgi:hypothetical protein
LTRWVILSKFKSELKKIDEDENHAVPKHYLYGPRKLNIILTQLRSSASFLNTKTVLQSHRHLFHSKIIYPLLFLTAR